jgi:hypothetical protein
MAIRLSSGWETLINISRLVEPSSTGVATSLREPLRDPLRELPLLEVLLPESAPRRVVDPFRITNEFQK